MPDTTFLGAASVGAGDNQYRIARWKAEFAEPAVESRFRAYIQHHSSRYLQVALLVWAALLLMFTLSDLSSTGGGPEFLAALGGRLVMVAFLMAGLVVARRVPRVAADGTLVTPLALIGFTLFFGVYAITAPEDVPWVVAVTMVMLMGLFVLLPNRMVCSLGVAVYAVLGTMICVALSVPRSTALDMVVLGLMLLLPAVSGLVAAYRFQLVRRGEFAALELAQQENERRRRLEAELQRQATTDPLTGVCNRRQYEYLTEREIERARRSGRPLSLCVLDLDHFKWVNDTYGHNAGDAALALVAQTCRSELREMDVLGRLGGEEFIVVLPDTPQEEAVAVAERLRRRLERTEVVAGGRRFRITATIGVTGMVAGDRTTNDLVLRADAALYQGKETGRNRVSAA